MTLLVVGRPYLFACQGVAGARVSPVRHSALFEKKGSLREDYLRVRATGSGVELFPNLSSGVMFSTTWGDGLVRQKVGEDISEGSEVDFLPYALFD